MKALILFQVAICLIVTGCATTEADYVARGYSRQVARFAVKEDTHQQARLVQGLWQINANIEAAQGNVQRAEACQYFSDVAGLYAQ